MFGNWHHQYQRLHRANAAEENPSATTLSEVLHLANLWEETVAIIFKETNLFLEHEFLQLLSQSCSFAPICCSFFVSNTLAQTHRTEEGWILAIANELLLGLLSKSLRLVVLPVEVEVLCMSDASLRTSCSDNVTATKKCQGHTYV